MDVRRIDFKQFYGITDFRVRPPRALEGDIAKDSTALATRRASQAIQGAGSEEKGEESHSSGFFKHFACVLAGFGALSAGGVSEHGLMQGATRKRWDKLCERAADEQDAEALVQIYKEIIEMLDEKASRLFSVWAKKLQLGWQPTSEQRKNPKVM